MPPRNPDRRLPPGIEQTASGHYRGRYRLDGRKRSTPSYPTIQGAAVALAKIRADIARGEHLDPDRTSITLNQWFTDWQAARHVAPRTLEKDESLYRLHIAPYLGQHTLAELSTFRIDTWLSDLHRDGRTPERRRQALVLMRTMLGRRGAIGDGRLRANPCDPIPNIRVERRQWQLVDLPTINRIHDAIHPDWQAAVLLGALAGLRWGEVLGLRRSDINPLHGRITVRRTLSRTQADGWVEKPPKGGRSRTIPMHPRIAAALSDRLRVLPPAGYVYGPTDAPNWRRSVWRPALRAAGVRGVRFHDLRHSCVSLLTASGMPLPEVMEIAGHASITTTMLYVHTDEDAKKAALMRAFGE